MKTRDEDQTRLVIPSGPEHDLLHNDGGFDWLRLYSISIGTWNTLLMKSEQVDALTPKREWPQSLAVNRQKLQ